MSISLLLEMAASSTPDREAVVSGDLRLTTQRLSDLADGAASVIAGSNAQRIVYVGTDRAMLARAPERARSRTLAASWVGLRQQWGPSDSSCG